MNQHNPSSQCWHEYITGGAFRLVWRMSVALCITILAFSLKAAAQETQDTNPSVQATATQDQGVEPVTDENADSGGHVHSSFTPHPSGGGESFHHGGNLGGSEPVHRESSRSNSGESINHSTPKETRSFSEPVHRDNSRSNSDESINHSTPKETGSPKDTNHGTKPAGQSTSPKTRERSSSKTGSAVKPSASPSHYERTSTRAENHPAPPADAKKVNESARSKSVPKDTNKVSYSKINNNNKSLRTSKTVVNRTDIHNTHVTINKNKTVIVNKQVYITHGGGYWGYYNRYGWYAGYDWYIPNYWFWDYYYPGYMSSWDRALWYYDAAFLNPIPAIWYFNAAYDYDWLYAYPHRYAVSECNGEYQRRIQLGYPRQGDYLCVDVPTDPAIWVPNPNNDAYMKFVAVTNCAEGLTEVKEAVINGVPGAEPGDLMCEQMQIGQTAAAPQQAEAAPGEPAPEPAAQPAAAPPSCSKNTWGIGASKVTCTDANSNEICYTYSDPVGGKVESRGNTSVCDEYNGNH